MNAKQNELSRLFLLYGETCLKAGGAGFPLNMMYVAQAAQVAAQYAVIMSNGGEGEL